MYCVFEFVFGDGSSTVEKSGEKAKSEDKRQKKRETKETKKQKLIFFDSSPWIRLFILPRREIP